MKTEQENCTVTVRGIQRVEGDEDVVELVTGGRFTCMGAAGSSGMRRATIPAMAAATPPCGTTPKRGRSFCCAPGRSTPN